jgi:hypothetical protein
MHLFRKALKRARTMRYSGALALFLGLACTFASAQQALPAAQDDVVLAAAPAPAGSAQQPDPAQATATLGAAILDSSGAGVANATVTLEEASSHRQRTAITDSDGAFSFAAVPPGSYTISVAALGFAPWQVPGILVHPGETAQLSPITLEIASVNSSVDAISQEQLADQQIKVEENQRLAGIAPNFYVSYVWNAAPLTPKQKFKLALRNSYDPFAFIGPGIAAGIEQSENTFSGYGQGAQGYAKRYGAAYADGTIETFVGGAILPSLFHQDPRYFYKGTGSIASRALYAVSTVVRCRGDNGRWQPNYSGILGNLVSAGISNAYYPSSDRDSAGVTVDNALLGTAEGALGALVQEFLLRKLTRHPPPTVPAFTSTNP